MLIIPIETKPDWSRPPWVTIGIVLINLIVFIGYQGNDGDIAKEAAEYYVSSDLLKHEKQLIERYLKEDDSQMSKWIIQSEHTAGYALNLGYYAFYTRPFDARIAREWSREIRVDQDWSAKRDKFENYRQSFSSFAYGLTPAQMEPITLVSSTYLHGGWDHIIGNMIFLFLFGFLLELVLGPLLYFAIYTATGVIAGLFFVWFNGDSFTPLVGASGAVSGLMGAYIVMYGVRKIKFFYTIGFYFGEFSAPALAILPLWLAKEIYGHLQLNDQVAYLAHFGGLISGAAAMAAIHYFRKEATHKKIEEIAPIAANDTPCQQALRRISKLAENLDFEGAMQSCKTSLIQYPNEIRLWQSYFDLAKVDPTSKVFHQITFDFLKHVLKNQSTFRAQSGEVKNLVVEYTQLSSQAIAIKNKNLIIQLMLYFFNSHEEQFAIQFLESQLEQLEDYPPATKVFNKAHEYFVAHQQPKKAKKMMRLTEMLIETSQK